MRIAKTAAARAGDPTPTLIQHSKGTRSKANLITSGAGGEDNRAFYLIAERGHFTAYMASPPPGEPLPTGSVLTLVVDASSGDVTDLGVSNNYPNLAKLGPVTTDLRIARGASVWLQVSPRTAHPGAKVRIVVINGSPRMINYGECFRYERLVHKRWVLQPQTPCTLVLDIQQGHTRRALQLSLPNDLYPGRYRLTLHYQASRHRLQLARTYLTVA